MTAPTANSGQNIVIISPSGGNAVEQELSCETHRIFDINHAVQILQQINWPALFVKINNVDEMVCSFMAVIDEAIYNASRSMRIQKNKRARLQKYVMKLTNKKRC